MFEQLKDGQNDVVESDKYKDPEACSLYKEGHSIAAEFDNVLQEFAEAFGNLNVEVVAGGCNGCTTFGIDTEDVDVYAYYVAQNSGVETLYLGYGVGDDVEVDAETVADTLVGIANRLGVPVDWDGDVDKCVCLGDAEAYED